MYTYMKQTFAALGLLLALSGSAMAGTSGLAGFVIDINGETNPYTIYSVFVMPGAELQIKSTQPLKSSGEVTLSAQGEKALKGKAPEKPGAYAVQLSSMGKTMKINILVMTPMSGKEGEHLNGYRIGNYPATPLKGNPIYNKPRGLFEVTDANRKLQLTPHFHLEQFLCKQSGDFPKYLVVRERLLLKLEYLLARVNEAGYDIETFGFISGYRTPYYNKSIGNVQYSRHVWGGAADIFVDQNKDGRMDDLNGDGKVDEKDVAVFHQIVEEQYNKDEYKEFRGGLGFYRKNASHSGFIHVDVRGWKARW